MNTLLPRPPSLYNIIYYCIYITGTVASRTCPDPDDARGYFVVPYSYQRFAPLSYLVFSIILTATSNQKSDVSRLLLFEPTSFSPIYHNSIRPK